MHIWLTATKTRRQQVKECRVFPLGSLMILLGQALKMRATFAARGPLIGYQGTATPNSLATSSNSCRCSVPMGMPSAR